ncbi:MAG TPA: phosphotransferase [Nonomuraea sp.]|nr:phosphotransferase [Nonomuraea sp.]
MADLQHTHDVVVDGDVVIKRFLDGKQGGAEREWRALTLLAEYAPGLAPEPVAYEPGVVSMTRVDGAPLRGLLVGPAHLAAMAAAVGELHFAVPRAVLDTVPVRPYQQGELCDWLWRRAERWRPRDPSADRAVKEGLRWLETWRPGESGVTPVFGSGDGNLSNLLWDGARVRAVDFEDSGRSDLAYELADLAEHVSMWVDGEVRVADRFELGPREERRLRECRRAFALMWLFLLQHDSSRNPPGTFGRQVERVLAALGA